MPYSFKGLTFGSFSVDESEELFGASAQRRSSKPPVEFLFEYEVDEQGCENSEEGASREGSIKNVPNGPDDSGVEVGLESEQECQPSSSSHSLFSPEEKGEACRKGKDSGADISFGVASLVEDNEKLAPNHSPTSPQDGELLDGDRSKRRRRKRKQHQRSGDVPCSSSDDSDRDRSPAPERMTRGRSGSGVVLSESKMAADMKNSNAESSGSNDSKSTESPLSPSQSDADNTSPLKASTPEDKGTNKPTTEEKPAPAKSTWADLFRGVPKPTPPVAALPPKPKVVATPPLETKKIEDPALAVVSVGEDKAAQQIAEMLNKASLDNESKPLLLRGLVNKANWCYINATLQALLVCPPFFNLMRQVELIPEREASTSTPILDSMVKFCHEFNITPKQANTGKTPKSDFRTGPNLEPSYIGKMLATIESTLSAKGHQEDAEEFLSCLLNGIHEEMIVLSKLDPPLPKPESHESSEGVQDDLNIVAVEGQTMDKEEEDAGDWEQVGPRNKSSITRVASFPSSLISDIFGGCLRSSVHQTGAKESANVEPFFCLQLDIQNVSCIEDALNHLTVKEELQGFTCSKTNAQIDVSRRVSFEVLPKVLILHLKRFIYSKNGSQKLQKHVDYPLELVIGRELLSPNVKGKYTLPKKTYKLCAVVYHHGKISSGGHYTADILHPTHGWVHTDDTKLKLVSSSFVLKPSPSKNPYLLYYRRADQIMK